MKHARAGGKFCGSHTTVIPLAGEVADIAVRCEHVTKISLGFIKAGIRSANGNRRVKVKEDMGSLLLSVRDNNTHQELRVYTSNVEKAKRFIEDGMLAEGIKCRSAYTTASE